VLGLLLFKRFTIKDSYKYLAPIYDFLVYLVYGSTLKKAKYRALTALESARSVVIFGGGTGTFTKAIVTAYPHLAVEFIESSAAMLAKAKKRLSTSSNIRFNTSNQFQLLDTKHDVVIAPFFFDQFSAEEIRSIIHIIEGQCHENPQWLVVDFQIVPNTKLVVWNKLRIRLTIWFFRKIADYPLTTLPQVFKTFESNGFKERTAYLSPNQLVRSSIFSRLK
jgi:ubiquinone/menaquinone biosynthesis C-methylase UbiE